MTKTIRSVFRGHELISSTAQPSNEPAMKQFCVRFEYENAGHLEALRLLYAEIKRDKEVQRHRELSKRLQSTLSEFRSGFDWPDKSALAKLKHLRENCLVLIPEPAEQSPVGWGFYSLVESMFSGDGTVLGIELRGDSVAELPIVRLAIPTVA